MVIKILKDMLRPLYRPVREYVRKLTHGPTRYEYLYAYIKKVRPQRILEIGTWNGHRATRMIRAAQRAGRGEIEYYGFDLFDEMNDATFEHEVSKRPPSKDAVEAELKKTGARVTLIQGNTMTLPEAVWSGLPKMDFVFIDGGHSLETVENDWRKTEPLMHEETVVLFDDYWNRTSAGAKPVVDTIDTKRYEVTVLPITDVFQKEDGELRIQFALVKKREHTQ